MGAEGSKGAAEPPPPLGLPDEAEEEMPFQYASTSVVKAASVPTSPTGPGPVVTVNRGGGKSRIVEPALEALAKCPSFLPVLPSTVGSREEDRLLSSVDSDAINGMIVTYQGYLKSSAESVRARQQALGTRMKVLDKNAAARAAHAKKCGNAIKKAESPLQQVAVLQGGVRKIDDLIRAIKPLMVQLNNSLSDDLKLEPFQFGGTSPSEAAQVTGTPLADDEGSEATVATESTEGSSEISPEAEVAGEENAAAN